MEDHETLIVNQFHEENQMRLKVKKLSCELEELRREEKLWGNASFGDKLLVYSLGFLIGLLPIFYIIAQAQIRS